MAKISVQGALLLMQDKLSREESNEHPNLMELLDELLFQGLTRMGS